MIKNKVLFLYLFRTYRNYFLLISFTLISILLVSNIFDNLQRFKAVHISTYIFWSMVFYKIPYLFSEISPLIGFLTMLFFLRRLTNYNELITMFCNGLSFWRVIFTPFLAALLFGATITYIIGPIGAYGLNKYEVLEAKILKKKQNDILISSTGILFFEEGKDVNHIIQIGSINLNISELKDVTILFINSDNRFVKRINAETALLKHGKFELKQVVEYTDETIKKYDLLSFDSDIEINDLVGSFVSPEKTNIWQLKNIIDKMLQLGLPVINYQIYYFKQIFKPLMMGATTIIAACFFSIRSRDNSQNKILITGIIIGFLIYSIIEIVVKILAFGGFSPMLSMLLPILLLICIGNFIISSLYI